MNISKCLYWSIALWGVLFVTSCKSQHAPNENSNATVALNEQVQLDNSTTTVYHDKNGHHWFGGGPSGLFRFDGENWKCFTTSDGLTNNTIIGIRENYEGTLYVESSEGVCKFDGTRFQPIHLADAEVEWPNWSWKKTDLWFRLSHEHDGAYRLHNDTLYYMRFPHLDRSDEFYAQNPGASWSATGLYTIYQDPQGFPWFGTAAVGVGRYEGEELSWYYDHSLNTIPGGGDFGIRSIFQDSQGFVWICNTKQKYILMKPSLTADKMNLTETPGVAFMEPDGNPYYPYVFAIVQDSKDQMWMSAYNEGVYMSNGKDILHYPLLSEGEDALAYSMYCDKDDVIWVGTHNKGVYRLEGQEFVRFSPY